MEIVDPFATASPRLLGSTASLYGPLIQHAPWFWGGLFHVTNSRAMVRAAEVVLRSVDPAIERLMTALEAGGRRSLSTPCSTVHAVRARRHLGLRDPAGHRHHRPGGRAHLLGVAGRRPGDRPLPGRPGPLPTQPGSRRPPAPGGAARGCRLHRQVPPIRSSAAPRRIQLGLDPDRFTVLVCSGADGSGDLVRRARVLARSGLDISLVVTFRGRNQRARDSLAGLRDRWERPVTVQGVREQHV